MKPFIYLDNSATTKVREEVVEAMLPFLTEHWGNASSIHSAGRRSRLAVESARSQVAQMIGAKPTEIIFTPNATYSNNAAILGRAKYVEQKGLGRHIITTAIEHSSALEPVKQLKARGWRVTFLPVDKDGSVDVDQLKAAITSDTSIISVMWANNEIGTIQPVHAIADIAAEHDIFFHTDAVQAAGKIKINVADMHVQSLSLSGHKFYAPKGIGIHYVRKDSETSPIFFGGGQEKGFAPGTENVANIVALGRAAELAHQELESNVEHLRDLAKIITDELLRSPEVKLTGAQSPHQRVPGHVSVAIRGQWGMDLVQQADDEGICIASSSACSSGSGSISHVLKALGSNEEDFYGALRISAGIFNTEKECAHAAELLSQLIAGSRQKLIA